MNLKASPARKKSKSWARLYSLGVRTPEILAARRIYMREYRRRRAAGRRVKKEEAAAGGTLAAAPIAAQAITVTTSEGHEGYDLIGK